MASIHSARLIFRGAGSGMKIASLLIFPGLAPVLLKLFCSTYWTCFGRCECPFECPFAPLSLSDDPRMSIRRGSSSSASWSPRSPASLKNEKSEPAESEECRGCLSFSFSSSSCSSESRRWLGVRVRRGMLEDLEGVEEGMVTAGEGRRMQPSTI